MDGVAYVLIFFFPNSQSVAIDKQLKSGTRVTVNIQKLTKSMTLLYVFMYTCICYCMYNVCVCTDIMCRRWDRVYSSLKLSNCVVFQSPARFCVKTACY